MKLKPDKQSLVREIEEQEQLVVSLEKQKDSAQARLLTLRAKMTEFDRSNHVERCFILPASDLRPAAKTVEEKVTLFRARIYFQDNHPLNQLWLVITI